MKCWRCQTPLKAPGYCGSCSLELDRERIWTDAGFNPDGTTPFAPESEPVDEASDPA